MNIIISKLKTFKKIDGILLRFVAEYLKGSKQSVVIGGFVSGELPVLFGVPQGSILVTRSNYVCSLFEWYCTWP